MSRKVYALFVGIDDYLTPVRPLQGCVNDVQRMHDLLAMRISGAGDQLLAEILTNSEATRTNIIAAFEEHLAQAGENDVVLFYYAGHGSQEQAPPEFWHLEPAHLNETLVCYDSRRVGGYDLADKELSYLIAEVAQGGAHVTIILDSCHSGSGTRDALDDFDAGVTVRLQAMDGRTRPIDSYIFDTQQLEDLYMHVGSQKGAIALPQGEHILLAACRDNQTSKETFLGGERRGVFSYYLQDSLQNTTGDLSYRSLFKRIQALVPTKVKNQTPVIETTNPQYLEQPFLGGAIPSQPAYFTLSYRGGQWRMDGGAVHGIAAPSGHEKTVMAIFSIATPLENLRSLRGSLGQAVVENVLASESEVSLNLAPGQMLHKTEVYQAVVISQALPPMIVAFEGDETALNLVREALAEASPNQQPSLLVKEGPLQEAEYRLRAERLQNDGQQQEIYRINRKADAYPLAVDTEGFDAGNAAVLVSRLEHIARWQKIAELRNPTSEIPDDAIKMEFFFVQDDDELIPANLAEDLQFIYRPPYGKTDYPRYQVRLTNSGDRTYHCMLLALSQDYSIFTGLLPNGVITLEPDQEAWGQVKDGHGNLHTAIPVTIPDKLHQQGVTKLRDIVKLIVSTAEADASLLHMNPLPVSVDQTALRGIPSGILNRLIERVHTRNMGFPEEDEPFSDWRTYEISAEVIRPMQAQNIPPSDQSINLAPGLTLSGHAQLQAQARLGALDLASRDLGELVIPPAVRYHPEVFQPLEFTSSRSGEPGLSLLELLDVRDPTVVTNESPLILTMDGMLAEDQYILPYAYDGEFFLPLGRAKADDGHTTIFLENLPPPTSLGERDLQGSIKIMFQKISANIAGTDYQHPQLAVADVGNQGDVNYETDLDTIRARIAAASKILLIVHGLFGDTQGITADLVAYGADQQAGDHDLILTFDYESINTPIEDSGKDLKERLLAVGLGANHGKELNLVAHSLGGLVARWFIEREGGHEIVSHLVTLGTPHNGSPWPKIFDWASTLLVMGLNGLSTIAWPVKILASLIKALEIVDVTADQLAFNSSFIRLMATNTDPGIPITAIAGNTSIVPTAGEPQGDEPESKLDRLLSRLAAMRLLDKAASLAFFGQPNDIAVSVASAHGLPPGYSAVTTVDIACDHMSFFIDEQAMKKLETILNS